VTAINRAMEEPAASFGQLTATSKDLARRLLIIGENRLELLTVELQEERERVMHAVLLALGLAVFGLLAGITFTGAVVVLLQAYSRAAVLLVLTGLYAIAGVCLYRRLMELLSNWETLSASVDQLRKDRACLAKILG
jgi:uncharacterized membrane protein YqjE